jgi:hypothetical protein
MGIGKQTVSNPVRISLPTNNLALIVEAHREGRGRAGEIDGRKTKGDLL